MMSSVTRLFIIDHHTLIRRGLAGLLNRRRDLRVLGDSASFADVTDLESIDVLVLEPQGQTGGVDSIKTYKRAMPRSSVLVLTNAPNGVARAFKAGARGFLHKSCQPDELVSAIQRLHEGEMVVGSGLGGSMMQELMDIEPTGLSTLTAREIDVLRLVAFGSTNAQVAAELHITEHTVKGHLTKILGKLGLDNRVKLSNFALQHGLVDLRDARMAAPIA